MNAKPWRVLVVEDDYLIALSLSYLLKDMGHEVCGTVASGEEAVSAAQQFLPSLILMDIRLRGMMDGTEAARQIRQQHDCRIVFVTGSGEPDTVARARAVRPDGILIKPILPRHLEAALTALA